MMKKTSENKTGVTTPLSPTSTTTSTTASSSSPSSSCFIKPSLSMTSLPPPTQKPPTHDGGSPVEPNKLCVDRPYNSLKVSSFLNWWMEGKILMREFSLQKKRDLEVEIWRRSWGSGHSHSSCSLQSSTTNAGSGTGKDEFWAALQTNYNYIMDTKLIESCKEARGECEGSIVPDLIDETDCCKKVSL